MELNTIIVGIYFLFLIAIGWMFRTFTSTTSDYFRGAVICCGGWLVQPPL